MSYLLRIIDCHGQLVSTLDIGKDIAQALNFGGSFTVLKKEKPQGQYAVELTELGKKPRLKTVGTRTRWKKRNANLLASRYKGHARIKARVICL